MRLISGDEGNFTVPAPVQATMDAALQSPVSAQGCAASFDTRCDSASCSGPVFHIVRSFRHLKVEGFAKHGERQRRGPFLHLRLG